MKINDLIVLLLWVLLAISVITNAAERSSRARTSSECQALGFSAGHTDSTNGTVCEQWTPAAKVRP